MPQVWIKALSSTRPNLTCPTAVLKSQSLPILQPKPQPLVSQNISEKPQYLHGLKLSQPCCGSAQVRAHRDPKSQAPEQDLPGEEVLSDVDLFLEGLQLVLSDCLCEGLSWLGKVPARQIRERHKKQYFSLAVPIQH